MAFPPRIECSICSNAYFINRIVESSERKRTQFEGQKESNIKMKKKKIEKVNDFTAFDFEAWQWDWEKSVCFEEPSLLPLPQPQPYCRPIRSFLSLSLSPFLDSEFWIWFRNRFEYVWCLHNAYCCSFAVSFGGVKVKEQRAVKFGHLKFIIIHIAHTRTSAVSSAHNSTYCSTNHDANTMIYRANHYFFSLSLFVVFSSILCDKFIQLARSKTFSFLFLSNSNNNSTTIGIGSRTSFPIRINKSSLTWCGNFNCYNNTTNSQLTIFPFVFLSIFLSLFFAAVVVGGFSFSEAIA